MKPVFLTLDEILQIHRDQIERYGGAKGIWSSALLHYQESYKARPNSIASIAAVGATSVARERRQYFSNRREKS